MTKDPVCAADVDECEAVKQKLTSDHSGRVYYFCSEACKQQFDRDPGLYMGHDERWESVSRRHDSLHWR